MKKLAGALGVGGTLAFLFTLLLFCGVVLTAAAGASGSLPASGDVVFSGLSGEVERYRELVSAYCAQYEIPDYVDLALAVMQQESGGLGPDPMQSSECPLNTQYPQQPGGITNPEYSVDCGVRYLANCLKAAKVPEPTELTAISLALQGYNFGNGYIPWARKRGGYTLENALEFSRQNSRELGWKQYGDPPHVLRYYSKGSLHTAPKAISPVRWQAGPIPCPPPSAPAPTRPGSTAGLI